MQKVQDHTFENKPYQNSIKFLGKELLSLFGIAFMNSATFPFEMIRTRLQTTAELIRQKILTKPYQGIYDCAKKIKTIEGYRAFWKGNFANICRVIPNEVFNFSMKQSIQLWLKKHHMVHNNFSLHFISASAGAVFTLGFIYPFDYARARLTNDITGKKSIRIILRDTFKAQGFRGIYRGSVNFFISAAIFRACYFGIFDSIKELDPNSLKNKIVGSYIGSMIAIYSVYPFDTIRKRMMMTSGANYKYKGFLDCANIIRRQEGIKSFYRGWPLSLGQGFGAAGCLVLLDKIGTDVKKKSGLE